MCFWSNCVDASSSSVRMSPPPSTPLPPDRSSTTARRRSATSSLPSDRPPLRLPSNSAPTPRKRLFPPPTHPQTGSPLQNKGPDDSTSLGLRELACRLNLASRNFDKAAENLGRAAQVYLSGEFLRQIVESEGKAVQAAAKAGLLPIDWTASDCPA